MDNVDVLLELGLHLVALVALAALEPVQLQADVPLPLGAVLKHLATRLAVQLQVDPFLVQHFVARHASNIITEAALVAAAALISGHFIIIIIVIIIVIINVITRIIGIVIAGRRQRRNAACIVVDTVTGVERLAAGVVVMLLPVLLDTVQSDNVVCVAQLAQKLVFLQLKKIR